MIYAYIRVSTDKQTVENQRFEINNYCDKNNLKIDKWINETVSGKMAAEKRKLGILLKTIEKNDVLICSELSRLSRTMYSLIGILEKCESKKINIIAIKENFKPRKDKYTKYLAPIFAITSEMERDLNSQRTKEGLARLKANGVKLGRPLGSKSKKTKLSGKETEIKRMADKNISLREMAKRLKVHRNTLKDFMVKNEISIKVKLNLKSFEK
jgi:DNA invertase Pin-like site-specific DNA recombinase